LNYNFVCEKDDNCLTVEDSHCKRCKDDYTVEYGVYDNTLTIGYCEKNENCEYPDVHYDCAVCKDEKISTLTNGYCSCNEGYSGPAYIECTKATADNNNNNNNSNAGTNNNSSNNNNNDNSGVSSNLPSMNHLALAVLIIGILFI